MRTFLQKKKSFRANEPVFLCSEYFVLLWPNFMLFFLIYAFIVISCSVNTLNNIYNEFI